MLWFVVISSILKVELVSILSMFLSLVPRCFLRDACNFYVPLSIAVICQCAGSSAIGRGAFLCQSTDISRFIICSGIVYLRVFAVRGLGSLDPHERFTGAKKYQKVWKMNLAEQSDAKSRLLVGGKPLRQQNLLPAHIWKVEGRAGLEQEHP